MFNKVFSCTNVVFIIGFAIGIKIALVFHKIQNVSEYHQTAWDSNFDSYKLWLMKKGITLDYVDYDQLSYGNNSLSNILEASYLKTKVSVICVVFVHHNKYAEAVGETWGQHCNQIEFFYLPKLGLTSSVSKKSWSFLCNTIINVWQKYSKHVHWVLFTSDDMFIIPENIRYFVAPLDYEKPYYFGHTMSLLGQLYNMGQASYILSKGSIRTLVSEFGSSLKCNHSSKYYNNEDFYLGKHLEELGIIPLDTRDLLGRGRFHAYNFNQLLFKGKEAQLGSYYKKSVFPYTQGPECCSDLTISFHATDPDKIRLYNYLIYHLKVFKLSGVLGNQPAPTPIPEEEVWRTFLKSEGVERTNISSQEFYELWQKKISSPVEFNKKLIDEEECNSL